MDTVIITTTINVPIVLRDYKKLGVPIIVVGDKKTPEETDQFCREHEIEYIDVKEQEKYLRGFPELRKYLPYNCIQRRNVGILMAYQRGFEKIITIDDDNLITSRKYLKEHKLGNRTLNTVTTKSGWFNVCTGLSERWGRSFYHRGYPLEHRDNEMFIVSEPEKVNVVVNAGLWFGDPDIDALTRLYNLGRPIESVRYENPDIALSLDTWSPFNSQNTALHRSVIPAYFLNPYIGRYDDIWASYIVNRISNHLGDYIAFGRPIVNQVRNPHNYFKDLDNEKDMSRNLEFTKILKDSTLTSDNYYDCYRELSDQMKFDDYKKGMDVWIKTIKRLQ